MKATDSIFYNLPSCGSDMVNQETISYANPKFETDNMSLNVTTDTSGTEKRKSKRKKFFKKVIKFFKEIVRPVLTFIPLYISALASYKRATSVAC